LKPKKIRKILELVLVCSPTVESLVDVLVSAQQEEPGMGGVRYS